MYKCRYDTADVTHIGSLSTTFQIQIQTVERSLQLCILVKPTVTEMPLWRVGYSLRRSPSSLTLWHSWAEIGTESLRALSRIHRCAVGKIDSETKCISYSCCLWERMFVQLAYTRGWKHTINGACCSFVVVFHCDWSSTTPNRKQKR